MNSVLLRQQIMAIAGNGVNPRFQLRAVFSVGAVKYTAQAVVGKYTLEEYGKLYTSVIKIQVAMITRDYMSLFKSRDNISVTVFQEQIDPSSEVKFANGLSYQTTYRGFLTDNSIASLKTDGGLNSTPFTDGSDDLRVFTVQLVDPVALSMSAKSAQGTFRLSSVVDSLSTFIISKTDEDAQKGLPKLLGLDIVDPDVTGTAAVRKQLIVDHRVKMTDLAHYLQIKEGGIYNHAIGSFIKGRFWYIYPLFNTSRFTQTERRLIVLIADSLKLPTADKTYQLENQTLTVISSGGAKTQDISVAGDINNGNGVHFQKATEFFESPVVDDGDNKAVYNRQTTSADIQRTKRADGLTFANVSENPITDNVPRELSKMASRAGMLMTVEWQRSDIRLLTPGMPVRVYYDNGSSTQTLEGTLLRAEEMWNTEVPGMTQKMQVSAASLTFFLRKPA